MEKTTRREFLKQVAVAGVAMTGLPSAIGAAEKTVAGSGAKSRVVIATDKSVLKGAEIVHKSVDTMLDKSMSKLMNLTAKNAWKKLFSPTDVVGIKVNCLFGPGVSTHPEVTESVIRGLKLAGVKPENIIIWDRETGHLIKSGYKPNKTGTGVQCYGDDGDWGAEMTQGAFKGRITKVISEKVTCFVNIPILKTHSIAGISLAMKNHYGSFDNPGKHHGNHCNPAMPDFSAIPVVKDKTRLVVVDAIRPQCDGGPGSKPEAQFDYWSLMVSRDPVAVDYQGVQIIQKKRAEVGLEPIKPEVTAWLQAAQERGVGVCDPDKIELMTV